MAVDLDRDPWPIRAPEPMTRSVRRRLAAPSTVRTGPSRWISAVM
ncbi:hypothetical protein [Saccharothrix xinjiangensis]|uniref:Uncharacterized protein n=1 Tax=Saccharothrix xinjiangensis TaxID=204798 RepID=A0ABV9Y3R5_9PSEU